MIRASVLGLALSALLAGSVASLAGCDGSDETGEATSAETIRSASVALEIQDADGNKIGTGSGILIAPKLVLTAGHLVAGHTGWKIRTADGKSANGVRGLTYDWLVYNSDKAHPRKHDVALVYLDKAIHLPAYPRLAGGGPVDANEKVTRINSGMNLPASLARISTFPNNYITSMSPGEKVDTGGAVLDDKNHIIGVVSGRGLTTNKLYIARTDQVGSWVASHSNNCASGSSSSSSSTSGSPPDDDPVRVRTYGTPNGSSGTTTSSSGTTTSSSGTTTSSSGTTTSSSGTTTSSSGTTTSSSGTTTSSSGTTTSSSSGNPPNCVPEDDGNCYGGGCSSSSSSSSSSSGSTTSSSGTSGTSGIPPQSSSSSGVSSSSGSTTSSSGTSGTSGIPPQTSSSSGQSSGQTSSGGSTSSSGTSGRPNPSSSSGQSSGQTSGSSTSGAATSSSGLNALPPGDDACEGPNDNPEVCPPEPPGCQGPTCGGGVPDDRLDYGGCVCGGSTEEDPTDVR